MDQLVEGVLAVGPRLTPHNRSGVVLNTDAIFGDVLPVGLHVALTTIENTRSPAVRVGADLKHSFVMTRNHLKKLSEDWWASDLLEVSGEAVHVLVVGQEGVSLRLEEVDVPDAQKGQQDGRVALQRSAVEVIVLQGRAQVSRFHTHNPTINP